MGGNRDRDRDSINSRTSALFHHPRRSVFNSYSYNIRATTNIPSTARCQCRQSRLLPYKLLDLNLDLDLDLDPSLVAHLQRQTPPAPYLSTSTVLYCTFRITIAPSLPYLTDSPRPDLPYLTT